MDTVSAAKVTALPVGTKTAGCSGIIRWARTWDWEAGGLVASRLSDNRFEDWETVFLLTVEDRYAGFCMLEKHDGWGTDIAPEITPFITAVYIGPDFRGRRLSQMLLGAAAGFARSLGFDAVYLISGHKGFYEKQGFEKFAQTLTLSGNTETVFIKYL